MKKKSLILTLFLFVTCTSLFSQAENILLTSKITNILELKYDYEMSFIMNSRNMSPLALIKIKERYIYYGIIISDPKDALELYKKSIADLKSKKETYLKWIETEIQKGDKSFYSNKFIDYYFQDPMSSTLIKNNVISKLDFLRIIKCYILDGNSEILPKLRNPKIPEYKFSLQ